MLKNIFFILLSLTMVTISTLAPAADDPSPQEAIPAETVPVAVLPADPEPASPPASVAVNQSSVNTRPLNDNHTDYRYCLELKTNIEIAQCRYKKK